MTRFRIAAAVLTVLVVAAAIVFSRLGNTTTAVEATDAVERFESLTDQVEPLAESPSTSTSSSPTTTPAPTATPTTEISLPAAGVYRLDLQGEERIDLLAGAGHVYPGESFLTVTATDCGADLRWDFIEERWQSWSFCENDAGPTLVGEQIFHSFFGQADLVDRTCTDSVLATGATLWSCASETSVAVRAVSIEKSTEVLEGLGSRDVLVLRTELSEGDHPSNIETIELWWDLETGLPVFEERFYDFVLDTPLGDAAYDESYRAITVSLDPIS